MNDVVPLEERERLVGARVQDLTKFTTNKWENKKQLRFFIEVV